MRKIEHLSSVEEYYQVESIIGTDWEFLLENRPRVIYNYIQEYLENNELFVNELNERDRKRKFLGYEKNCAIRVVQELSNSGNKKIAEQKESTLVKQFMTYHDFDKLIRLQEMEKPKKKDEEIYDNTYLAQQYIEHLNSEDEIPTLQEYEAYMIEMPEEQFIGCSDKEIEAMSMEYFESLLEE